MGSRMEWRGPRFWEAGVEGGARNGAERSEVRSLERRLPKSVAMGDAQCSCGLWGCRSRCLIRIAESVVIEHRRSEVAKRRMGPPVVVANEPFPHPHP